MCIIVSECCMSYRSQSSKTFLLIFDKFTRLADKTVSEQLLTFIPIFQVISFHNETASFVIELNFPVTF